MYLCPLDDGPVFKAPFGAFFIRVGLWWSNRVCMLYAG